MSDTGGPRNRAARITIGLPVFNGERFIEDAIVSIRQQTMPDFELLIADNASTDDTLTICRSHEADDSRIVVMTAQSNRGAAWNFNRCVTHSTAPFFKWAAHDDVIDPTYLDACLSVIEHDPTVVLTYPKAVDIDTHGVLIGPIDSRPYATQAGVRSRVNDFLSFNSACVETFGVIRNETLRETLLIGAYTSSDRTLLLELLLRGRFSEVDEVLMRRRQHESRSVRSDARKRNEWFDPTRRPIRTSPRWRLIREFHRAVSRSKYGYRTKITLHISVVRWAAKLWKIPRSIAASLCAVRGRIARS